MHQGAQGSEHLPPEAGLFHQCVDHYSFECRPWVPAQEMFSVEPSGYAVVISVILQLRSHHTLSKHILRQEPQPQLSRWPCWPHGVKGDSGCPPGPPARRSPRCWWWSCCSLPSCGCPAARWCCSTPLWPSPSWTLGCSSSVTPACMPTAPSTPSFTASCPRSSGRPSGSYASVGHRGARLASAPPATAWSERPPRRRRPVGVRSSALRQLSPHSRSRCLDSARSEGCPPPAQPLPPPLVCSPAGSCLLMASRARRWADTPLPMAP